MLRALKKPLYSALIFFFVFVKIFVRYGHCFLSFFVDDLDSIYSYKTYYDYTSYTMASVKIKFKLFGWLLY